MFRYRSIRVCEGKNGRFGYNDFRYDAQDDTYVCPAGQRLIREGSIFSKGKRYFIYGSTAAVCGNCPLCVSMSDKKEIDTHNFRKDYLLLSTSCHRHGANRISATRRAFFPAFPLDFGDCSLDHVCFEPLQEALIHYLRTLPFEIFVQSLVVHKALLGSNNSLDWLTVINSPSGRTGGSQITLPRMSNSRRIDTADLTDLPAWSVPNPADFMPEPKRPESQWPRSPATP